MCFSVTLLGRFLHSFLLFLKAWLNHFFSVDSTRMTMLDTSSHPVPVSSVSRLSRTVLNLTADTAKSAPIPSVSTLTNLSKVFKKNPLSSVFVRWKLDLRVSRSSSVLTVWITSKVYLKNSKHSRLSLPNTPSGSAKLCWSSWPFHPDKMWRSTKICELA